MTPSVSKAAPLVLLLIGCSGRNDALKPPLVYNADALERDVLGVVIADVTTRYKGAPEISPKNAVWSGRRFFNPESLRRLEDSLPSAEREIVTSFRNRNADGVVSSHDYHHALVYATYVCGELSGEGYYLMLERDASNVWHIAHKRSAWVS